MIETKCICQCGNEHMAVEDNENEDYDMLARENKAMAEVLSKLGYTDAQISDIANGAI